MKKIKNQLILSFIIILLGVLSVYLLVSTINAKATGTDIGNEIGAVVGKATGSADAVVNADVEVTEMMGAETFLYLKINGESFTARVNPRSTATVGDTIKIAFDVNKIHLFDKETELAILN